MFIVDDFAFRKLKQLEAEMLNVLAEERLGRASTSLTSNRPPEDLNAIFPNPVVGRAILDRLVSVATKIIKTKGKSFRREGMGGGNRSLGYATC
ncbi:MAG: ATP-binding protein [Spirochaetia bacterium]|jgi:DNA replication protein DnaC